MPSFEDAGSRSGYALDFFCRSRMLADILFDLEQKMLEEEDSEFDFDW